MKKLMGKYNAVVIRTFIPKVTKANVWSDEEASLVSITLAINSENIEVTIVKNGTSKYSELTSEDKVVLLKYATKYDYDTYAEKLREKVFMDNSVLPSTEKEMLYNKYIKTKREFLKKPQYIIEYEIEGLN